MLFFITDRKRCGDLKLLLKTREAALAGVDYILLRENDLDDSSYKELAYSMLQMLVQTKTELVICHRDHIARALDLKMHNRYLEKTESSFSVSVHSMKEVKEVSNQLFFYSPVFETECKKGVSAKGIRHIDSDNVIALGGINIDRARNLSVKHVAVMSEWLTTESLFELVKEYKKYGY